MSLRARLSLVTVVVASLALIAANLVVYQLVTDDLEARFDERISSLAGPASRFLTFSTSNNFPELPRPDNVPRSPSDEDLTGIYSELRAADGSVIARGFAFAAGTSREAPRIPDHRVVQAKLGKLEFFDAKDSSGDVTYRVLALRTPDGGIQVTALATTDLVNTEHRIVLVQSLVSLGVVAIGLVLTWLLVGLGLRPLRRIGATAERIAEGDLTQRVEPAGTRTEIERLGASLNAMLSEIESAFDAKESSEQTLRRFIADASHELRTPVTSIRGYAELLRRGADDDPAERLKAAGRIEQEARRMGLLVDELLWLARLDEGAPLVREPLDLVRLAQDLVQDARVVEPARTITVRAPDSLMLSADRAGLTRVMSNLLTNARIHTPAGTPIEVEIELIGETVELRVVDHGPGIDLELGQLVFERFWRADSSRSPTSGGSGLGLAIVAAVVTAHHGEYAVSETPGGGATFAIRLPREEGPTPADRATEAVAQA